MTVTEITRKVENVRSADLCMKPKSLQCGIWNIYRGIFTDGSIIQSVPVCKSSATHKIPRIYKSQAKRMNTRISCFRFRRDTYH